jgi:NAD(P)-dependent dehydrogenase (short-subunit alcohol dehydrogenase family)
LQADLPQWKEETMTYCALDGKVAIVTGASKGIGRAIALGLAEAGAKVTVASRKLEGVAGVAREIDPTAERALAVQAHMGYVDQVDLLVAQTVQKWGRLDIAVNNAATNPHFGPLLTADEGQIDKTLDVNVKGYLRLCRAVVPHMRAAGSGKIINIASTSGLRPGLNMGVYCLTKAAVIMLTQVLAMELGRDNIQVNAIAPGTVKTKLSRALWEDEALLNRTIAATPLGRIGAPEDVVGAALYLASGASDWVTGSVLVVDGGATLGEGL